MLLNALQGVLRVVAKTDACFPKLSNRNLKK
jgi:hypothetical protein